MFGRGYVFVLVLLAAFFAPYLLSKATHPNSPLAGVWNSHNGNSSGYLPGNSNWSYPVPNNGNSNSGSWSLPNYQSTYDSTLGKPQSPANLNSGYPGVPPDNRPAPTPTMSPVPSSNMMGQESSPRFHPQLYRRNIDRQQVPATGQEPVPNAFYPPGAGPTQSPVGRVELPQPQQQAQTTPPPQNSNVVTASQPGNTTRELADPFLSMLPATATHAAPITQPTPIPAAGPANYQPGEWVTVRTIPGQIVNDPRSNYPGVTHGGPAAQYSHGMQQPQQSLSNASGAGTSQQSTTSQSYEQGYGQGSYSHSQPNSNSSSNQSVQQGQGGNQDRTLNQSSANQGPPPNVAEQLFRFDLQPDDVAMQFSRVSTHLIDSGLQGLRVPLVSGTDPSDLAGSLTYFFDAQNQLQRVSFLGTTGDPSGLISLMQSKYGLQAEPTLGGGTFLSRNRGNPQIIESALRMRRAPVMRDDQPLHRYFVSCELNQPGNGISDSFQSILLGDAKTNRWNPGHNVRAVAASHHQPAPMSRPANPLERPPDPRSRPPGGIPRVLTTPVPDRPSPG